MTEVNQLITMGFSKTKTAEMLGISRKTLYNKTSRLSNFQGGSVTVTLKYTDITDTYDQLDSKITSIKRSHNIFDFIGIYLS